MTQCAHCPAPGSSRFQWTLSACANGGKKRVFKLCAACDVKLNRMILRFVHDPDIVSKMKRYRERQNRPE